MSNRSAVGGILRGSALLCCLLGAGCSAVKRNEPPVPPAEPVAAAAPGMPAAPAPAAVVEPPAPASAPVAASPVVTTTRVNPAPATSPKPKADATGAPVVAPAKPPAAVAARVPAAPAPAPPTPAPSPKTAAPKPAAPPLDLAALEVRLRETRAIGVMTKLSLKNQVDDLLDKFRAYYKHQAKTTLAELRRPYDMLLLKVLSLLQDTDPPLARDIVASREAIWGILADPQKFNEAKLMAGEMP